MHVPYYLSDYALEDRCRNIDYESEIDVPIANREKISIEMEVTRGRLNFNSLRVRNFESSICIVRSEGGGGRGALDRVSSEIVGAKIRKKNATREVVGVRWVSRTLHACVYRYVLFCTIVCVYNLNFISL